MATHSGYDFAPQTPAIQVDEIDYSIIRHLTSNPRMSFSELGDRIGRSRATARERVKRLISQGMIDFNLAVRRDILESFKVAVVEIKIKESKSFMSIDGCPRILTVVGPDCKGEITVMMLGESEEILQKCIDHLHLKNQSSISSLNIGFTDMQVPHYLTLRTFSQSNSKPAECLERCASCEHHQSGACYGCPAEDEQFGSL
ncbi:MAG: Lrp/AsnC family transcriptional regulator [Candidatus Heimdallarchaeota archaeon]